MFIGTCEVDVVNRAVKTSRNTFPITEDTHVSVDPVFRMPAILISAAIALFVIGFHDLLYAGEILTTILAIFVLLVAGFQFSELHIWDRVTRGTEQSIALRGLNYSLQKYRAEIYLVSAQMKRGDA